MNINTNISKFRVAHDPIPVDQIPLWRFFASVQQGEYAKEVSDVRSANDPEVKALLKKRLPAVTISGTFTHRKAEGLVRHSGYICLDFDGKGNSGITDWKAARNDIASIQEVVFCSLSASGNGCFAVLPLAYPDEHRRQFEALKRDLPYFGYYVDPGCGDVCRLRFMSHDPGAIINPNPKSYKRIYTPQHIEHVEGSTSEDEIYRRVRAWLNKSISFIQGERHNYIKQLAGGLHRFGASEGYTLSRCLEYQQEDFTDKEIESIVRSIYAKSNWFNIINSM